MKLTVCYLLFLSVVNFELGSSYVTSSPDDTKEVPSTHKPHILTKAATVSVIEGQNVTFQCSVDELGEFVIIWMKNSEVYFVNTHNIKKNARFSIQNDNSLHIENVHINDAAIYVCQISTGPPTELHHTLIVTVAPKAKTIPESGLLIVKLGEPMRIGCDASGVPPPVITWTHSMKEIIEHVEEDRIFIPEVKKQHAGVYECKVDNGVDTPALGKIEVNVHYKPTIKATTKLIYTGVGASAEISCDVFGEPTPKITWFKDNVKMTILRDQFIHRTASHTHTLIIRKVTSNDLGTYTCKAENSLGDAMEMIEITGIPAPVKFKYGVNDTKSDSYAMKWSVTSHSPVNEFKLRFRKRPVNGEEYEWTEVSIPAEKHPGPVHSHTYDITGLEPASVYEAIILTRNNFGWSKKSEIFIFSTEGAVPEINEDEFEKDRPMNMPTEEASLSKAEIRTNTNGGAERHCWTPLITLLLMILFW